MNLTRVTTRDLIAKYGLDDNIVDFHGHALTFHRDYRYLNEPALDTVKRMKVEFNEEGKVIGATFEGEIAKCKKVVYDSSYLPNKVLDLSMDLSVVSAAEE
ncbi:guanosine nucleotide diphosphate dissociation inhibitor 2 [Pyrus ussuriensis x Pyrus communis]|uniref:Guanosine nucleotide diphosphate dissociation inhibitor 2 n=1 Tax=Pyrus ussuriensis x Pyrus communis TaxID=2448454 RepID=A0A5N5FE57_9ROSA|nr:guanosine nucleotide diphosphate dissociation inhibitor 2 [Pyrus ussuriensis x Pyrus communis]